MWTDERVTLLRKLWAEGLSASQIAKELRGVTRNAVIGKVHRIGLAKRATSTRTAKRPARQKRIPTLPAEIVPPQEPTGTKPCVWPLGDPRDADFHFCGNLSDSHYCAAHRKLAYVPQRKKAVDPAKNLSRWLDTRARVNTL